MRNLLLPFAPWGIKLKTKIDKMVQKTATVLRGMVEISQKVCIFVVKDIYYAMRNRIDLFSRVKSGKFSSDENKLTFPIHIIMAWAVAYFSPRVYQSLHDKISLRSALSCVRIQDRTIVIANSITE